MNTQSIRMIINRRAATDDEYQQGVERCWDELSSALASDYDTARRFMLEECTPDEESWVSEVYGEIIRKTQDRRYVDLLRLAAARFPEEDRKYRMREILERDIAAYYTGERDGTKA